VTAGSEAFASSLASAVEGIVVGHNILSLAYDWLISHQTKPLEGAGTEGALGFFSGVGKGLVG
jgi:vacuolar protein sorting-associated protein 13A/C